ncbi:TetR family transcriptional regulator [Leucobacter luti]|uniref:TetR/AcrR family transcriptional regulator n=1 Tax=Leucobacter luti TaxID=340320 RepID=UPI0010485A5D|nr:TetR/AcrR family transcriptional regulator [Leucobacter luti]MCW2287878.1 AcrR family transcriptional regulator [Leucobacter luti]TCK45959.1 TetR family transcriptional regulator [Leucobacter luti]
MAWDTAATQRQLLDAGARQFAAHGLAGARMDRIGTDAGVNKERVYQYFGNKQGLFDAVLADRLADLLSGAGVPERGPEGIGKYAGEMFDYFNGHTDLARLLAWESLELSEDAGTPARAASCAAHVRAVADAMPGLSVQQAGHLLLSIVALCASWWTLTRVTNMIVPTATSESRRTELMLQCEAMARTYSVT